MSITTWSTEHIPMGFRYFFFRRHPISATLREVDGGGHGAVRSSRWSGEKVRLIIEFETLAGGCGETRGYLNGLCGSGLEWQPQAFLSRRVPEGVGNVWILLLAAFESV